MSIRLHICWLIILVIPFASCGKRQPVKDSEEFAGSGSCQECHTKFYDLWSTSHHGKAMQPINAAFIQSEKLSPGGMFRIEGKDYAIIESDSTITMVESDKGKTRKFPLIWALGGKNVYYFLTPLENGKLQTIPLAYDQNLKKWYNNPQSAVRHITGKPDDRPLQWMDRMYTFNTACYSCHISQLKTNFDLSTDSYRTIWKEAGINCETCHGPANEHIRIFRNAKKGKVIKELGLISAKKFSSDQQNWACAPCHAKMRPITTGYLPGDRFFDNFDLTILNDPDFYPDGRDLGENYTYTGWLMNQCKSKSDLNCVTCHTSSGRNKFKDNPNDACKKCHPGQVENVAVHSGHKSGSDGAICVNCHMQKSEFAGMKRSDHSFRPPMPEASIRFGSPNACNLCHQDKSPEWANSIVKQRPHGNYQEKTIHWASLMQNSRQQKWDRLNEMLDIISRDENNEVIVASFIRSLNNCSRKEKWPVIVGALKSRSPLVRSSAAEALSGYYSNEAKDALIRACSDEYRVVRIAAAATLSGYYEKQIPLTGSQIVENATREYITSIEARPDDWSSHYNLGIFYQGLGENGKALESYETAVKLYPEALLPLINSSVLYSSVGNQAKAEENLQKALAIDPVNEAANLNYGLILAELGKTDEAVRALRTALKVNPGQAVAAYNLSVILSSTNLDEAIGYARIAAKSMPTEPKYGYTLAFYLLKGGKKTEAVTTLQGVISHNPLFLDSYWLLADIYIRDGRSNEAIKVYRQAIGTTGIQKHDRSEFEQSVRQLQEK
jgi:tetratricopeptide (TPR) repeat protein